MKSHFIHVFDKVFYLGMHATVATTVMADIMTVIRLSKANTFLSTLIGLAILISLPIAG